MKVLLVLFLPCIASALSIFINTQSGLVIGTRERFKNILINRFLGVPFAEPPVGNLRFKKTVPVSRSVLPILANAYPPACVQNYPYNYPWVDRAAGQSEDCLYLNIWAPANISKRNPKAVLFWTHGGGFSTGSNRLPVYDGKVLSAKGDVVVVTINYRLNIFGFLSTGTKHAPGNMGLFDALEALQWVNNNIEAFGGDRNRITVFGESAGSIISSLFCVSPLTRGLFQQVIMESGSPVRDRGDVISKNLKLGQNVAEAVGCASSTSTIETNPCEVVKCLREKDAMDLIRTTTSFNPSSTNTFVPIHGDEFLPENPREEIIRGNFQNAKLLIGNVRDEGSFTLPALQHEVFGSFGERDPKVNKSYGADLILKHFKDFDYRQEIVNYYLDSIQDTDYDIIRSEVYNSVGDFRMFCPTLYFAESMSKKGTSVYYYYFTHRPTNTPWAPWMGVAHFDDVSFVFGRPLDISYCYNLEEKNLSEKVVEMWTNFAKFGSPSRNWKQFSSSDPYMKLLGIPNMNDSYLEAHLHNCDFYRTYLGF